MLPALAVIAASALLKHHAIADAQRRQENIRRSMEQYQRSKAAETTAATEALIDKQTPAARAQEMADVTNERQQSLKDTVGAVQGLSTATPVAGKLSGDFKSTEEANAGRIAERTRRAIEQMATMGAPSEQQQRFGIRFGRAAGTVDAGNRASANVGDAYLKDVANVQPNRWANDARRPGLWRGPRHGRPGRWRIGSRRRSAAEPRQPEQWRLGLARRRAWRLRHAALANRPRLHSLGALRMPTFRSTPSESLTGIGPAPDR
jgi:hypothetical protein